MLQRLQRTHLDLQQQQQQFLILQHHQQLNELQHLRSKHGLSNHLQQQQQWPHESSMSEYLGKHETIHSFRSSPSFRNHSSVNSARPDNSSSESDSDEGHGAFVRAAVHTTIRTEKRNSSMSSNSASVSSLPSSVASSQEFQANGSENRPSTDPVHLESGFHLRYQPQCVVGLSGLTHHSGKNMMPSTSVSQAFCFHRLSLLQIWFLYAF